MRKEFMGTAALVALAAGILAAPAMAQQQEPATSAAEPESTDTTIVVTGIREALATSANEKRNADNVKDVVTAEDIGKFPDENVAESLGRVTGVQITRDDGEGDSFTIRGISQNRVEINGRTAVGRGEGRNPNISDIPADLLGSLEVIKSPTADLVEGSLGGTVNLRTRRPFDFRKPTLNLNLRQGYTNISDEFQPQINVLATDRWNTGIGDIGALLNVSYSESRLTNQMARPDGWTLACNFDLDGDGVRSTMAPPNANGLDDPNGVCPVDPGDTAFRPANFVLLNTDRRRDRLGVTGSLQWKPSSALMLYLDGNYTYYHDLNARYNLSSGANGNATAGFNNVQSVTVDEDGFATSLVLANRRPTTQSQVAEEDSNSGNLALGMRWKASSNLRVEGEIGGSKGRNNGQQFQVNGSALAANNVLRWNSVNGGKAFTISYDRPITDPQNFRVQQFNDVGYSNIRREKFGRVDFDWTVKAGPLSMIEFGARVTDERFERDRERSRQNNAPGGNNNNIPVSNYPQLLPFIFNYNLSDFLGGLEGGSFPSTYFAFNTVSIFDNIDTIRSFFSAQSRSPSPEEEYILREQTQAAYLKFNVDGTLGNVAYRGNAGARLVRTSIDTTANILQPNGNFGVENQERSYTRILPSANLAFELGNGFIVRGAFAKTMVRPDFGELRPAYQINLATGDGMRDTPYDGNVGNPLLDPFEATQYDLSFEKYWGRGNLVSFNLFYRDVAAFIRSIERLTEVPGVGFVELRSVVNGDSATIKGFEANLQTGFDFLPGFLNGFGALANYTFSDSEQSGENSTDRFGDPLQLEQLSKHAYNLALFYERGGVDARVSYNWRDRRLITSFSNFSGRTVYIAPEDQLDFSAGWDVNPSFRVSFDVRNILGRFNREYVEREAGVRRISTEDTKFTLGVRAKF